MYCPKCGKKLKKGEVCACQDKITNKMTRIVKGILTKPITTIKENTKETNFNVSLVLTLIMSLLFSLFLVSYIHNSCVFDSYPVNLLVYSPYFYMPFVKTFIVAFIVMYALTFAYAGILYLVNTIMFKGTANYEKVYSLVANASVILSIALLLGTLIAFVNVAFTEILFVLGAILMILYLYHGIKFLGNEDENTYGYIFVITSLFFYIVLTVTIAIIYF